MKHILTLVALLGATSCVSAEKYRQVLGANSALQAEIAGMSDGMRSMSAELERLRAMNQDLGKRAADASYLDEQKRKLADLLARYGTGTPSATNGVELVQTGEGYAFRVAGGVLFSPGQNTLSEGGKKTLSELAAQLQNRRIRIEGHTDDQPISRSQWGTNLRLSVERAMVVSDYLTTTAGLRSDQVAVAGYGEYRPATSGTDDTTRQKNRRVEILLIEDK
jgi:chemotaxis protein MotB